MPAKPSIFISYRRTDSSAVAGRIYDRLVQALGKANVFKDSYNIPHGADFRGVIKANVSRCNIVVVIIGQTWLTVTEKDNPSLRRLDNPNDWVRFEVETGLQTPSTTVIPVLVQNASMPSADVLPPSLRELAFKNGLSIRDDPDFDSDMARLIQTLPGGTLRGRWLSIAVMVLLLGVIGLFVLSNRPTDNQNTAPTTPATVTADAGTATLQVTLPTVFTIGSQAVMLYNRYVGSAHQVRIQPRGGVVTSVANGAVITIIGGPQVDGDYVWWQIRTPEGIEGWIVEADGDYQNIMPLSAAQIAQTATAQALPKATNTP